MTSTRVPQGVPTGGQFAASAKTESGIGPLLPATVSAVDYNVAFPGRRSTRTPWSDPEYLAFTEQVRPLMDNAERLIARETMSGDMTPAERHSDVAFDLREQVPNLSDADFDTHMAAVANACENVSVVETAPADETRSYEPQAIAAGVEECDHHVTDPDDWAVGDAMLDCEGYQGAVIEFWDAQVRASVETMLLADRAAAEPSVGRTA